MWSSRISTTPPHSLRVVCTANINVIPVHTQYVISIINSSKCSAKQHESNLGKYA